MGEWNENALLGSLWQKLAEDSRIAPPHIGLVMALLYHHNGANLSDDFHASRKKLMRFSGIRSVTTYHKYLEDLVKYGYIRYVPCWHPEQGSKFAFAFD